MPGMWATGASWRISHQHHPGDHYPHSDRQAKENKADRSRPAGCHEFPAAFTIMTSDISVCAAGHLAVVRRNLSQGCITPLRHSILNITQVHFVKRLLSAADCLIRIRIGRIGLTVVIPSRVAKRAPCGKPARLRVMSAVHGCHRIMVSVTAAPADTAPFAKCLRGQALPAFAFRLTAWSRPLAAENQFHSGLRTLWGRIRWARRKRRVHTSHMP